MVVQDRVALIPVGEESEKPQGDQAAVMSAAARKASQAGGDAAFLLSNEKIPLTPREGYGSTAYESLVSTDSGVIYCCHGNPATACCDKRSKSPPPPILEDAKEHCHTERDLGIDKIARRKLLFASALCLVFMFAEFIGGYLSNSLAIASDAAHLLTDLAGFMISLLSLWMATRPATRKMSFGWYRAEVIGALTSVLLIWVVTGILVYMAVMRVIKKEYEIDAQLMVIIAALGLGVNIVMALALNGVPHGHSHGGGGGGSNHGHSHGKKGEDHHHSHENGKGDQADVEAVVKAPKSDVAKGNKNLNVQAALIHVIGDFVQSLGVLVAAIIIWFRPDWGIVDPICTFIFSVIVLFTTARIIREALTVLMEGTPKGIDFLEVQTLLLGIPGVVKVHNLRIWALSMDKHALSAHVAIRPKEDPIAILRKALAELRSKMDAFEITLQVEEYRTEMSECTQCQDPVG